ncbi:MAG: VWA domain-containing protein [Clostridiales bacterium]|nr:VWA domain-containing protein [Clostridiales bacterium]
MKRIVIAILILSLLAALASCGGSGSGATAPRQDPSSSGSSTTNAAPPLSSSTANDAPSFAPQASASTSSPASDSLAEEYYISNSDEEYLVINENRMVPTSEKTMLTFSLKVDTASYRNVVRYIGSGNLPPADAVRIEEMVNYFHYDQILAHDDGAFAIYTELGPSPFSANNTLAFVRVKSKEIDREELRPSNLTFLIDVSGSMNSYDKLPLLKSAFGLLVETLGPEDSVSIVTYASESRVALDSARGNDKKRIMDVINGLEARGSTAGGEGIQAAYRLAEQNFIRGGNNRVILATDGDFNVGISSVEELERFISQKRETGVYLSVLGFGTENIKDNKMETLAKNGNGNYHYLDSVATAKKVLVDELAANLYVIAEDVKAQVEFNPALVSGYRLIGYENRRLENRDFADDTKDAGEIGIGTDVVLMFELTLQNGGGGDYKYTNNSPTPAPVSAAYGDEFFEVRIRYKDPYASASQLITYPVTIDRLLARNTADFNFASSVAAFGHLLRDSQYTGSVELAKVIEVAEGNPGMDEGGLRREFVRVLRQYRDILR